MFCFKLKILEVLGTGCWAVGHCMGGLGLGWDGGIVITISK